ncbi:tether containing UBX domain for GLUT4 isoform X1 [Bombus pyrosoma]|uniref:tether containing UBX domain for GLUT4 isoform X1 n=2 Tax=Bombus pyrosoma TaxID=396416 RepID=UPI001CB90B38|nr:tether containing UBX domain for GLUT4 isoform X1 [Bombus pyrosoma]XP_043605300.1 tether containing UBX domain for GLUT4 isoform X1 [Bombus pyrosoma]
MATNKNVIVLVPNGRRQNIGVTPNTTILQILEEVCQKHGYNVDSYDLKHFNHVLDPNAILRFAGLANNAQLEMVPCTKIRSISNVTIGIQLENGERLMSEFTPNVTLAEILKHVNFNEDLEKIILIYMHREISGLEALKNTTLKSLGLVNGKAVLRLIQKRPQGIGNIALTTSKTVEIAENFNIHKRGSGNEYSLITDTNETSECMISTGKQTQKLRELKTCSQNEERKILKREYENNIIPSTSTDNYTENQILLQPCNKHETDDLNNIEFLGERNALVFDQTTIQRKFRDELPDDFYDLTVDDAKILLRDAKRYREELEEAPLLTNIQRQSNQEKRILNQLNKYHYTIIRIQFPDQFVLQGLFQPMETVQAIKDFIKCYLIDANSDFIIFTTPPKRSLNPNSRLVNENLVPCAIVYYSGSSALKLDVKEKFTDPKKVELQVANVRKSMLNKDENINNDTNSRLTFNTPTNNESVIEKGSKIPKWLNPSFK